MICSKAIKIISSVESINRMAFFNEISLLKKLTSEYIIKYFDHFQLGMFNYCIITEFCEVRRTSLFKYIGLYFGICLLYVCLNF